VATLIEYFVIAIAGIFVIINPLTTAFVFASLTPDASEPERDAIARRAVITSTAVLFTFALLGSMIFQLFGITLAAFRIAGGVILFGIAMGMLHKSEAPDHGKADARPSGRITEDISIVPLSIPFISGPGRSAASWPQLGRYARTAFRSCSPIPLPAVNALRSCLSASGFISRPHSL
jgi:multiple antibiotic resistance protein